MVVSALGLFKVVDLLTNCLEANMYNEKLTHNTTKILFGSRLFNFIQCYFMWVKGIILKDKHSIKNVKTKKPAMKKKIINSFTFKFYKCK
jgi:hypothetical protein